ncbi:MAG TPA: ribokinase [Clostridiaceae bacterium]|nr:ribokinase [Clostridiaceae bacterium]
MRLSRLLVVGSLNMDMVVSVPAIPKVGETLLGRNLQKHPGGKGANQAYAAASLGGNVSMIGAVGKDEHGVTLLDSLKSAGVDVSGVKQVDCNTGLAIIYVDNNSQNCIVVLQGANNYVDEEYIDELESYIKDTEWIILQMEIPQKTVEYVIRKGAELNKKILLNPAPAPESFPEELYKMIDIITPNEVELESLTGLPAKTREQIIEVAKVLNKKGVKQVIVTCGDKGAILVNGENAVHFPAPEVKAVDTTAAGDTFTAAVAVALSEGKTINEAIVFANCSASISVTRPGAQSSIPSRREVEEMFGDMSRKKLDA